jgi:hypothetical protein
MQRSCGTRRTRTPGRSTNRSTQCRTHRLWRRQLGRIWLGESHIGTEQGKRVNTIQFSDHNVESFKGIPTLWCGEPAPNGTDTQLPCIGKGAPPTNWTEKYVEIRWFFPNHVIHARRIGDAWTAVCWNHPKHNPAPQDVFVQSDLARFGTGRTAKIEAMHLQLFEYRDNGQTVAWRLALKDSTNIEKESSP